MKHQDIAYYQARAAAERELAQSATSPKAREVHGALAGEYEALVRRSQFRSILSIATPGGTVGDLETA